MTNALFKKIIAWLSPSANTESKKTNGIIGADSSDKFSKHLQSATGVKTAAKAGVVDAPRYKIVEAKIEKAGLNVSVAVPESVWKNKGKSAELGKEVTNGKHQQFTDQPIGKKGKSILGSEKLIDGKDGASEIKNGSSWKTDAPVNSKQANGKKIDNDLKTESNIQSTANQIVNSKETDKSQISSTNSLKSSDIKSITSEDVTSKISNSGDQESISSASHENSKSEGVTVSKEKSQGISSNGIKENDKSFVEKSGITSENGSLQISKNGEEVKGVSAKVLSEDSKLQSENKGEASNVKNLNELVSEVSPKVELGSNNLEETNQKISEPTVSQKAEVPVESKSGEKDVQTPSAQPSVKAEVIDGKVVEKPTSGESASVKNEVSKEQTSEVSASKVSEDSQLQSEVKVEVSNGKHSNEVGSEVSPKVKVDSNLEEANQKISEPTVSPESEVPVESQAGVKNAQTPSAQPTAKTEVIEGKAVDKPTGGETVSAKNESSNEQITDVSASKVSDEPNLQSEIKVEVSNVKNSNEVVSEVSPKVEADSNLEEANSKVSQPTVSLESDVSVESKAGEKVVQTPSAQPRAKTEVIEGKVVEKPTSSETVSAKKEGSNEQTSEVSASKVSDEPKLESELKVEVSNGKHSNEVVSDISPKLEADSNLEEAKQKISEPTIPLESEISVESKSGEKDVQTPSAQPPAKTEVIEGKVVDKAAIGETKNVKNEDAKNLTNEISSPKVSDEPNLQSEIKVEPTNGKNSKELELGVSPKADSSSNLTDVKSGDTKQATISEVISQKNKSAGNLETESELLNSNTPQVPLSKSETENVERKDVEQPDNNISQNMVAGQTINLFDNNSDSDEETISVKSMDSQSEVELGEDGFNSESSDQLVDKEISSDASKFANSNPAASVSTDLGNAPKENDGAVNKVDVNQSAKQELQNEQPEITSASSNVSKEIATPQNPERSATVSNEVPKVDSSVIPQTNTNASEDVASTISASNSSGKTENVIDSPIQEDDKTEAPINNDAQILNSAPIYSSDSENLASDQSQENPNLNASQTSPAETGNIQGNASSDVGKIDESPQASSASQNVSANNSQPISSRTESVSEPLKPNAEIPQQSNIENASSEVTNSVAEFEEIPQQGVTQQTVSSTIPEGKVTSSNNSSEVTSNNRIEPNTQTSAKPLETNQQNRSDSVSKPDPLVSGQNVAKPADTVEISEQGIRNAADKKSVGNESKSDILGAQKLETNGASNNQSIDYRNGSAFQQGQGGGAGQQGTPQEFVPGAIEEMEVDGVGENVQTDFSNRIAEAIVAREEVALPRGNTFAQRFVGWAEKAPAFTQNTREDVWHKQRLILDNGQRMTVSVKKSEIVMQIQLNASSGDIHRFLQQNLSEIKAMLEERFELQIDLQMQNRDDQAGQSGERQSNGTASNGASLKGLNDLGESVSEAVQTADRVRRFGFNEQEWTA